MKKIQLLSILALLTLTSAFCQFPSPAMVGYWENWGGNNMVKLKDVDSRYNVICIAFTENSANYDIKFTPSSPYTEQSFKQEVAQLQSEGRKIIISIGGQNGRLEITSEQEKNTFVQSVNDMIDEYGFDGLDIDVEGKTSLNFTKRSIDNPQDRDPRINFLIDGIKEVMENHKTKHGEKLFLTMAPETAYVQGALSQWQVDNVFGGAYLPVIEDLRDEIDMINVQLYNSGGMLGLDGKEYQQGTGEFVLALTEAIIEGFTAKSGLGTFSGLPASKVGVGLSACFEGHAVPAQELENTMRYLLGKGPKTGSYTLRKSDGYPDLAGMMAWSITSDARCTPEYSVAKSFDRVFFDASYLEVSLTEPIYEGEEDGKTIEVILNQDEFVSNLDASNWSFSPTVNNVSIASVERTSATTAIITLTGNSTTPMPLHANNLTFTASSDEFINSNDDLSATVIAIIKAPIVVPGTVEAEFYSGGKPDKIITVSGRKGIDVRTAWGNDMEYTIDVAQTGTYVLDFTFTTGNGTVRMATYIDGKSMGSKSITGTGPFKTYYTESITMDLEEGVQTLKFDLTSFWMVLDKIEFREDPLAATWGNSSVRTFNFFPNPSSDIINFSSELNGELNIYNINGLLVSKSSLNSSDSYKVSNLTKGVYVLEFINTDGTVQINKLVKQ